MVGAISFSFKGSITVSREVKMKMVKLLEGESIHYRNKNVDTFIYFGISHTVCSFAR